MINIKTSSYLPTISSTVLKQVRTITHADILVAKPPTTDGVD